MLAQGTVVDPSTDVTGASLSDTIGMPFSATPATSAWYFPGAMEGTRRRGVRGNQHRPRDRGGVGGLVEHSTNGLAWLDVGYLLAQQESREIKWGR